MEKNPENSAGTQQPESRMSSLSDVGPFNKEDAEKNRDEARRENYDAQDNEQRERNPDRVYDAEYRLRVDIPVSDLFSKRRALIEDKFPALKSLSREELRRYNSDEEFRKERDNARREVPGDVAEEHSLLGYMVGRLEYGMFADLTPRTGTSSPNSVPTEINVEGYGPMVVSVWKAKQSQEDLTRMRELHNKNSEIIDFSQEDKVDIDKSDKSQEKIDDLTEAIGALETARFEDFIVSNGERPKAAQIYDEIMELGFYEDSSFSHATRQKMRQKRHEFEKKYLECKDNAELKYIDAKIAQFQQEKAEIEARREKYKDAGAVSRFFNRLFASKRNKNEEGRIEEINSEIEALTKNAGQITNRLQRQKH